MENSLEERTDYSFMSYYKPLESTFDKLGFTMSLVKAAGFKKYKTGPVCDWRIYRRKHKNHIEPHFEVVAIVNAEAYTLGGATIEAKEAYPSPEQWGDRGFTCKTLAEALKKFQKVTSNF